MKKRQIISYSAKETQKLAKKLARDLKAYKIKERAIILALEGDLGGGKTTFLQGFAKGLGIKEKILSPTFVIMRKFKIKKVQLFRDREKVVLRNQKEFQNFYHIDCYRVQKPKEILDLGWTEIIKNPQNIIAVEWADRIKRIIPRNATKIKFQFINKNTRQLTLSLPKG